jgi:CelD/BcsL family acetyltransferase involved in cellulose biosynthesis
MPALAFDSAHADGAEAAGMRAQGLRVVTDREGFDALREPWNRVAAQSSTRHGGVFGTHEWHDAALLWQPAGAALRLLCFERDGELAAVLPLVLVSEAVRGYPVRELRFAAVPDTQAADVLVAADGAASACGAFAASLHAARRDWDVIRLGPLAPDSVTATTLRDAFAARGYATALATPTANRYIELGGSFEAWLAARSRRVKKALNLAANRLNKAGMLSIAHLAPGDGSPDDAMRMLAQAMAISGASWKRDTGNALDQAGPRAFIERLTAHAHARGWLSLWLLELDGRPVAVEYQLVAMGNVYSLRSDFDASFEHLSPGSHLNRVLLERLFGSAGGRYYMGPGENAYKARWGDTSEPVQWLAVYGRTARGRVLAAWERWLAPAARSLRARLRGRGGAIDDDGG